MLKSHSASVDLELNTLYCTNAETKTPIADLAANKHYWKHVAYLTRLVLEVSSVTVVFISCKR